MDSKKLSIEASERELLQIEIASNQEKNENGEIENKIGEELVDRLVKNGTNWNIIIAEGKTYGTGWNFVKKGTDIPEYGNLANSWLINYETGDIIELNENFRNIKYCDTIYVTDSLIFNLDNMIFGDDVLNSEVSLKQVFGEDVDLLNFNYNEKSGLSKQGFKFDGYDDQIKLNIDLKNKFKDGVTFEFLGTINDGGTLWTNTNEGVWEISKEWDNSKKGLCGFFDGNVLGDYSSESKLKFGFDYEVDKISRLVWSFGYHECPPALFGGWGTNVEPSYRYWDRITNVADGTGRIVPRALCSIYLSVKGSSGELSVLINGIDVFSGAWPEGAIAWQNFLNSLDSEQQYRLMIGGCKNGKNWGVLNGTVQVLRIYGRELTKAEMIQNLEIEKSVRGY